MASKGGGGMKRVFGSIFGFILAGGLIFAWANVNDVKSPEEVIDYARAYSDYVSGCMQGEVQWDCDNFLPTDKRDVVNGNTGGDSGSSGNSDGSENGSGESAPPIGAEAPANPDRYAAALSTLDSIPVAEEQEVDYDRSDWKHWIGGRCDSVREQVLRESGENVKLDEDGCKVASGTWVGPYNGETITSPKSIDIDHVIPLSYANSQGGNKWDAKKKEQFANDKRFLLATSASENRRKSDKGPSDYMPPNEEFHCEYSSIFVEASQEYGLSLPKDDVNTLRKTLRSCS